MSKYAEYLEELKSTTIFKGIPDDELLALLDAMDPEIVCKTPKDLGNPGMDVPNGVFAIVLRCKPLDQLEPRLDVYNMPKPHEPGMMMGEIPALSEVTKGKGPRPKKFRFKGFKPLEVNEYMLRMTPEMVTRFYGAEHAQAQSMMMRNFLGILAQKVTDTRREKDRMEQQYLEELAPYRLHIFHAGVAAGVVKDTVKRWNELHPELPAKTTQDGSVDLIRECLAGEPCDVLISADDLVMKMMLPQGSLEKLRVWAGNRMVVMGSGINDSNWEEKLLDPDAVFSHHDPYGDPGGYRSVMAMLLADKYKEGLTEKLMAHPGHQGMEHAKPFFLLSGKRPDYEFGYYTAAKARGIDHAELPDIMNLGNEDLAEEYAKVSFAVDEDNTVTGSPVHHGITIPETAMHKEAAEEFLKLFMETDFEAYGFRKL